MYRMVMSRVTSEGETTQVEVQAKTGMELLNKMDEAGKAIDGRLWKQNMRILAAHSRLKTLTPDAQMAVHEVFQLLTGQRLPRPGEISLRVTSGERADDGADEFDQANGGPPGHLHPGVEEVTQ